MLIMKSCCEFCNKDVPPAGEDVYICAYERTYCANCAELLEGKCPRCDGRLQLRPPRPMKVATACKTCAAPLAAETAAEICSYLNTYCMNCAALHEHHCPSCGGELRVRPIAPPLGRAVSQSATT
jgi:uncharacterized protein